MVHKIHPTLNLTDNKIKKIPPESCLFSSCLGYFCLPKKEKDMKEQESIRDYYTLRESIEEASSAIAQQHPSHMKCQKGCDSCCMAISVFPVEFYAIQEEQREFLEQADRPEPGDETACRFLVDHACTIYTSRPVICQTHGLPLLYMNSEGTAWELSHCEQNFREVPVEAFHSENTLVMDTFNSRLFQINQAFVSENASLGYHETDRIPLAELFQEHEIIRLS